MEQYEEGFRTFLDAQVHDVDDASHEMVTDFPIVLDAYRSDFGPSAFQSDWDAGKLPVICVNHNQDRVIGRAVAAESLHDRHRLRGRFADFNEVPDARSVFSMIRDGIYPGQSFHFIRGSSTVHPNTRSARRFTKATMVEYGPVVAPAIPGAQAVGLRSEEVSPVSTPTLTELRALRDDGTLTEAGFRAQIEEHYPSMRDHIRVKPDLVDLQAEMEQRFGPGAVQIAGIRADAVRPDGKLVGDHGGAPGKRRVHPDGKTVGEDGLSDNGALPGPDMGGGNGKGGFEPDEPGSDDDWDDGWEKTGLPNDMGKAVGGLVRKFGADKLATEMSKSGAPDALKELAAQRSLVDGSADMAQGVDMAMREIQSYVAELGDAGLRALPWEVQEALIVAQAASVASAELLAIMDLAPVEGVRAALTAEDRNKLDDDDFGYIAPDAKKGGPKSPENGYHFPIHDAAHVRNALSRIAQGAEFGDKAKGKVMARAKKFGVDASDDDMGDRSLVPPVAPAARLEALLGKQR